MSDQPVDPLTHLGGGFVGEGDGEDGVGSYAVIFDQVSDAVGDDARLARTGSGKNEHWPFEGLSGFSLLRIEFTEIQLFSLRDTRVDCAQREKTTRPSTIVCRTRPRKRLPMNGEFLDFDFDS